MAKIDVIMPQMGESIAEGTLSRWIKKVGEPIKRDEPIFEISTDKVDAEIPAPTAGVLAEILVQEGETVAVQTVVARIETDATAAAEKPKAPAAPSPGAPAPQKPATPAGAPPAPLAPGALGSAQGSIARQRASAGPVDAGCRVGGLGTGWPFGQRCHRRERCGRIAGGAAAAQVDAAGPEDGGGA